MSVTKLALVVLAGAALCSVQRADANPDAKRLYDDLLSTYNRLIRPVANNSHTVLVKLGLRLSQLIELNLKDQILTTNVWLEHEWRDHKFQWEPSEYGGQTELYVPSEHIWLPDIVLYNKRLFRLSTKKARQMQTSASQVVASSSTASSPDSFRLPPSRPGGCNGLHAQGGATNRFAGLSSVLAGLDDSLSDVAIRKKYPFELEKAIHNVLFIKHHMQRQDEFDAEDQDWRFVAMVMDRLFLWIFTVTSLAGTVIILCEAPSLWDETKAIDTELSNVAQQQYLPNFAGMSQAAAGSGTE
nr:nicotinic acetylcholine receptor alpha 2 subunit transcript variant X3 [Megalurothrips usitatus]